MMSSNAGLLSREAVIHIRGEISDVFRLFEPLNEKLWVDNWNPGIVYPSTGEAVEDMIFTTKPRFEGEGNYTWILTKLDHVEHRVHYAVYTPDRIWFIKVHCKAIPEGTKALIRYDYVALNEEGSGKNEVALRQMFAEELRDWETALNQYLFRANQAAQEGAPAKL